MLRRDRAFLFELFAFLRVFVWVWRWIVCGGGSIWLKLGMLDMLVEGGMIGGDMNGGPEGMSS